MLRAQRWGETHSSFSRREHAKKCLSNTMPDKMKLCAFFNDFPVVQRIPSNETVEPELIRKLLEASTREESLLWRDTKCVHRHYIEQSFIYNYMKLFQRKGEPFSLRSGKILRTDLGRNILPNEQTTTAQGNTAERLWMHTQWAKDRFAWRHLIERVCRFTTATRNPSN